MKVTFRYDEPEDENLRLVLRITLGNKHLDGPATEVVKLVADYYTTKKFPGTSLDASTLCLKVLGGDEIDDNATVRGSLKEGDEVYLLPKDATARRRIATPAPVVEKKPASTPPKKECRDGKLRCKRFGCNKYYVEGSQEACRHHKSPPIFHETAKYWSCCSNKKAYDWDEFERIPGCEETVGHTQEEAKKKFLGGTDLRAENTPQRIDGGLPTDPRKQLDMLRTALMSMGAEEEFFDRVWGRLAAKYGDLRTVADEVRKAVEIALEKVSSPDVDMPDH